jgi:hypothetical protein
LQRNGQKRDKTKLMGKDDRKKVFCSQLFRPKAFDMDFPQNVFYGVFELPLLRNAQKRLKKIKKLIKNKAPTPFSGHLPDIRRFQFFFLWRPLRHPGLGLGLGRFRHLLCIAHYLAETRFGFSLFGLDFLTYNYKVLHIRGVAQA